MNLAGGGSLRGADAPRAARPDPLRENPPEHDAREHEQRNGHGEGEADGEAGEGCHAGVRRKT